MGEKKSEFKFNHFGKCVKCTLSQVKAVTSPFLPRNLARARTCTCRLHRHLIWASQQIVITSILLETEA